MRAILVSLVLVVACGGGEVVTSPTSTGLPPSTVPPTTSRGGEAVPPEVPKELLEAMKADLAARAGVDEEAIRVVESQQVTWDDGSLGCPKSGEMYTQALVKGYRVILAVDDRRFDYRATRSGSFEICRAPIPESGS